MKPHKVVLDSDLAESLWRMPARSRQEIIAIFEKLADYPQARVEDQIRALDGRMIQRARFGNGKFAFGLMAVSMKCALLRCLGPRNSAAPNQWPD